MPQVRWIGPPPPPDVVVALQNEGWTVAEVPAKRRSKPGAPAPADLAETDPTVVSTRDARQIPEARGGAWLWWSPRAVASEAAREATRRGAYDVVGASAQALLIRLRELAERDPGPPATPDVIAGSPAARRLLDQAWRAARANMPVLLTGETGTGKEVMAGLVHRWSARGGAYVPINCAAIPNELMESELFGHIRGAFSGAVATVDGKLLAATGGTVFLDEIDDTPLNIQNKLLRVLEDGQVTRVGETQARPADFRLVAATNQDLLQLIGEGRFGRDFYERLAIVRIELPRLADRREDIPAFARHFIARFYARQGIEAKVGDVAPAALDLLQAHEWPGNIRQLRNVLYQALVYKRAGHELLLSDLRPLLEGSVPGAAAAAGIVDQRALAAAIDSGRFSLRAAVRGLERDALTTALARSAGQVSRAARLLGEVGRGHSASPEGTVRAMIKRLGL